MQTAHNGIPIPHFMYGTAWKKEDTSRYVQLAVQAGFRAIDTANQLIHYHEALVGEALLALAKEGDHAGSTVSPNQIYARLGAGPPNAL